jgi:hypothetical protein
MTFQSRTDIFRPPLVRLLGRHKSGKVLTTEEISDRCELDAYEIMAIASMDTWQNIQFGDMMSFVRGCGLGNLEDGETLHRAYNYIRFAGRPKTVPFRYLRNSPDFKTYYLPLMIRWRKSYGDLSGQAIYPPLFNLLVRLTPLIK